MTKRIALLVSLVMIFSLSFVFATEENQNTLLVAPAVSGEAADATLPEVSGEATVSGEVNENVENETISGEVSEVSGEEAPEENVSGEVELPDDETANDNETNEDETANEDDEENSTSSTVVGAIIAIVVVIAVVAIVSVLQKK